MRRYCFCFSLSIFVILFICTPLLAKAKKSYSGAYTVKNEAEDNAGNAIAVEGLVIVLEREGGLEKKDIVVSATDTFAAIKKFQDKTVPNGANTVLIALKGATVDKGKNATVKFKVQGAKMPTIKEARWAEKINDSPLYGLFPIFNEKYPVLLSKDLVADPIWFQSYDYVSDPNNYAAVRVEDLQFMINVPEIPLSLLEYDPLASGFGPPQPSFVLTPGGSPHQIPGLPEPDGGNWIYAQGILVDDSDGHVIGNFIQGVQVVVPEPSGLALLFLSCGMIHFIRVR